MRDLSARISCLERSTIVATDNLSLHANLSLLASIITTAILCHTLPYPYQLPFNNIQLIVLINYSTAIFYCFS